MPPAQEMNILLVDDNPDNLLALEAVLHGAGYNLIRAGSGVEALRCVLEQNFAVILLDVQMPEMDGFETAALIRKRPRSQHTPIIFLTAINTTELHVAKGYSVGAIDYVCKPFDPGVLRAKVGGFVELARKTQELLAEVALRKEAEERLQKLSETLERRVAERTTDLAAANAELLRAKEAAEAASRVKSLFLANMSHELRTPLNAVIGYSEMLAEEADARGLDDLLRDIRKVNTAGHHLLSLISNILDLAKIEAGGMEMLVDRFDVARIVREVHEIALPLIKGRRNQLHVRCPPDAGTMRSDPTKLRQALLILLSNATKFTEQGEITLEVGREASPEGDVMVFRVADTGVGIADEHRDRIFTPFTQADPSTTRRFGGNGLGLAIARSFCRMMGGDVAVESAPGQGATFTIRLPALVRDPSTPP